jgi:hypothetical protein
MVMLRKDMAQLDLQLLEAKLKLRLGEAYTGSPLQGAVARLQALHARVQEGGRAQRQPLPAAAVAQLDSDLRTLAAHAAAQHKLQAGVDANIQRHEAAVFERLRQLQSHTASSDSGVAAAAAG